MVKMKHFDEFAQRLNDLAKNAREEILNHIAVLVLVSALLLTGCGAGTSSSTVTEYTGDYFTVTRQGHETRIVDAQTGAEYLFTTRHVKKAQTAAEAADRARMTTAADTDTLTIKSAYNVITVTVNATGETYLFRSK